MKATTRLLVSLLLTIGLVLSGVSTVWATVAANTQITNEATLSYGTGANAKTAQASVTVTVSLVSALATVAGTGDQITPYTQTDTQLPLQFTITANSNGPEIYSIAATNGSIVNTTTPNGPMIPAPFTLGASVTAAGSTNTVIKLPSDGNSDDSINGLQVGDTVVINGETRTIIANGFTDPASGIAAMTLDSPLTNTPLAGVPVQEQKIVSVVAYSGTVQLLGDDVVVPINLSITNIAGTTVSFSQNAIYTTGLATLSKYVRNVSRNAGNANGTGGQSFTFNSASATYYSGGVTCQSGDILEYVLFIQNNGNGSVPNMRIDDNIPVQFVTIKSGDFAGMDVLHKDENNVETTFTITADGDNASIIPPGDLLVIYVGTGATNSTGGSISAGKSVLVSYRVTIK